LILEEGRLGGEGDDHGDDDDNDDDSACHREIVNIALNIIKL
jgi:hypothetical protein